MERAGQHTGFHRCTVAVAAEDAGYVHAHVPEKIEQPVARLVVAQHAYRVDMAGERQQVVDGVGAAARDVDGLAIFQDQYGRFA